MTGLSERRVEILRLLIVEGLNPKQIASRLKCAEKTIAWHIVQIYAAFGIRHNPWVAARIAVSLGIVDRNPKDIDRIARLERLLEEAKDLLKAA